MSFSSKFVKLARNTATATSAFIQRDHIVVAYWSKNVETHSNWGDAVNSPILRQLTGHLPVHYNDIKPFWRGPVICGIGSIAGSCQHHKQLVWGSGFKNATATFNARQAKVLACRGPLTRQVFSRNGIAAGDLYGDPALLYPSLFPDHSAPKQYRLGIIPHYADYARFPVLMRTRYAEQGIAVIDICGGIRETVAAVTACEKIISTSLHGLILADAYSIPNRWIRYSKQIGDDFKFQDYFAGAGRPEETPVVIEGDDDLLTAASECRFHQHRVRTDHLVEVLLEALPRQI